MPNLLIFKAIIVFCLFTLNLYGQSNAYEIVVDGGCRIKSLKSITLQQCDSLLSTKATPELQSMYYLLKGKTYHQLQQSDSAVVCFQQALGLDSTNRQAYLALISHYNKKGLWQNTLYYYQKIIQKCSAIKNYEIIDYYYNIFSILNRQNAPLQTQKPYADYLLNNISTELMNIDTSVARRLCKLHSFFIDYYLQEQQTEEAQWHQKKQIFYERLLEKSK